MPQKSARSRSFISACLKQVKKAVASPTGLGAALELLPISNVALTVPPVGNGPKNRRYISIRRGETDHV